MEHEYTIESLAYTFAVHAEAAKQHRKQMRQSFEENNPGQDLPEHMINCFSLSQALAVMCAEIEKIKLSHQSVDKMP